LRLLQDVEKDMGEIGMHWTGKNGVCIY